jgi:hypothetical protein
MNNTAAKTIRRDLRRALGEEALGVLDAQTNAIQYQILPNQNALQQHVDGLIDDVKALGGSLGTLHKAHTEFFVVASRQLQADEQFIARGLWARLRWLFTGH